MVLPRRWPPTPSCESETGWGGQDQKVSPSISSASNHGGDVGVTGCASANDSFISYDRCPVLTRFFSYLLADVILDVTTRC